MDELVDDEVDEYSPNDRYIYPMLIHKAELDIFVPILMPSKASVSCR
jgi:hypothetical protein